jgi:hypothetical protein
MSATVLKFPDPLVRLCIEYEAGVIRCEKAVDAGRDDEADSRGSGAAPHHAGLSVLAAAGIIWVHFGR